MPKRPKQPKRTLGNSIRLGLFWAIIILASLAAWAYMTPQERADYAESWQYIHRSDKQS